MFISLNLHYICMSAVKKKRNHINYFSRNNLGQEFGYKGENTEITHNK